MKKILIVEDSPVMGKLTQKNIESFGFETAVRKNSAEAIAYIGNNKTDMILMDIELMGSKMDGIQTAKVIRSKFNIPVIYLTASEDIRHFKEANITSLIDIVMKPYDPKNLKMQIETSFYNHQLELKSKELKEWHSTLLEIIDDSVFLLDLSFNIINANAKACGIIKQDLSEIKGKDISEFFAFAYEQKIGFSSMTHFKSISEIEKDKTGSEPSIIINDVKYNGKVKVKKVFNSANEELGYILKINDIRAL